MTLPSDGVRTSHLIEEVEAPLGPSGADGALSGNKSEPIQALTGKSRIFVYIRPWNSRKKAKTSEVGNSFTHILDCKLMGPVAACFPEELNQMWMFQISCCGRDGPCTGGWKQTEDELTGSLMLCPEFHAECWESAFPRTLRGTRLISSFG